MTVSIDESNALCYEALPTHFSGCKDPTMGDMALRSCRKAIAYETVYENADDAKEGPLSVSVHSMGNPPRGAQRLAVRARRHVT